MPHWSGGHLELKNSSDVEYKITPAREAPRLRGKTGSLKPKGSRSLQSNGGRRLLNMGQQDLSTMDVQCANCQQQCNTVKWMYGWNIWGLFPAAPQEADQTVKRRKTWCLCWEKVGKRSRQTTAKEGIQTGVCQRCSAVFDLRNDWRAGLNRLLCLNEWKARLNVPGNVS